jgi:hypothetical protein
MRSWLLIILSSVSVLPALGGPVPAELDAALQQLRTNAPLGWAFTQTTEAEGRSRVERFEPIGPEPARWRLLQVDGRVPTEDELEKYRKQQTLRAGGAPAPNVKDQIDRGTCELLSDDGVRGIWRFRLVPGKNDPWAPYMAATFTLHRPTGVIERVELGSLAPFAPMTFTNIEEARTVMVYSLPEDDRPALLQEITVRIRGRAWFIRSLDSDMTVRYSDYRYAAKKPLP